MNWMDFMVGASAGMLVWAALEKLQQRQRKAKADVVVPPPQYDPKDVAPNQKPSSQWHSLPGDRIELGTTGFWIELRTKPGNPEHPYHGYTPEGRRIVWGGNLVEMKRFLESEARERAEFEPPKGGWKL